MQYFTCLGPIHNTENDDRVLTYNMRRISTMIVYTPDYMEKVGVGKLQWNRGEKK